ncbi:MAG: hypothetical protein M3161_07890 [Actinomycetota bacterium]|nr:hypothetical protein [Actinomycetota bacterium]
MTRAIAILEFVNLALMALLALVTFVQWRRGRHPGALWVFLTFGVLGAVALTSLITPDDPPDTEAYRLFEKALIATLLLFPYFLYRVSASFVATSRKLDVVAAAMTTLVIGWNFGLPELGGDGEPRAAAAEAFVVAVLVQWTVLSIIVAVRFWRAGHGRSSVATNRMRMLAVASLLLSLVIVIAGEGPDEEGTVFDLVTDLITLCSVVAFFLAFAPPRWLRQAWVRPVNERLRQGTVELMGAATEEEVTRTLLPAALEIVSGEAIAVVDNDGNILGSQGFERSVLEEARLLLSAATADEHERLRPDLVSLKYNFGWLLVKTGPYTTFFGREEIQLLGALGALANLAIERVRAEELKVQLAQTQLRRQQALEINDNIVQGLAVAKYAFELEQYDRARAAVEGTLTAARKIISDLLEELGDEAEILPGSLQRDVAATGYTENVVEPEAS